MKVELLNTETSQVETWELSDLITWLNADRNEDWKPYTLEDWKDGLEHFGHPYSLIKN